MLISLLFRLTHRLLLESLDELTDLAVKFFSPIANRGQAPAPVIPQHPFGENERGVCIPFTSYLARYLRPSLVYCSRQDNHGFLCLRIVFPHTLPSTSLASQACFIYKSLCWSRGPWLFARLSQEQRLDNIVKLW